MKRIVRISGFCGLLLLGCDADDGPPTGEEQGPCFPNGTCNEGLVCASDLCVDLDGGTSEASETSGPEGEEGGEDGGEEGTGEDSTGGDEGSSGEVDDPDGTTGSDSTSSMTSTSGSDTSAGGDDCPAPGCESYASKMNSCYPMLDINWYAECLNHYDICGAWECLPGTAGHVSCVNSTACENIVDGACNQLDEQC